VEIERPVERQGIFACAACLWKEATGGSARVPDTLDDYG
jgi:hypothetical protein